MTLPNLFSRRKRASSGTGNDVYQYDTMPDKLRVQIVQIITEGLGEHGYYSNSNDWWDEAAAIMRKEKGVFKLRENQQNTQYEFSNWFLTESNLDLILDGLEISCRLMLAYGKNYHKNNSQLIDELNARMREAAFGYEYVSGEIVRVDNYVIHSQVVKPALLLLSDQAFSTANDEYLSAHHNFRTADYETAVVDCGKAFESTLKIIGKARNWPISDNDTASKLVAAAYNSGFIPTYMQTQFAGLRSLLDAGPATVRNKMGAHGAGNVPRQVDKHLAAYQLHQTAAAILFLIEHHKSIP